MTILGIDPSLYGTGWAVVECGPKCCCVLLSGTIDIKRTATPKGQKKRQNMLELGQLHSEFVSVLSLYKFSLDAFALEVPISLPGQRTEVLWMVQGLLRGLLGASGLPCGCYDPGDVKAALTGSRKAEKEVVERFVQAQLSKPYKFGGNDESDAAAIALTHWHRQQTNQLLLPAMQKQKTSRKRRRVKC